MAYNNIRLEKDQVITYNNTLIMGIVKCKTLYYSVLCRIIFEKTTDCSRKQQKWFMSVFEKECYLIIPAATVSFVVSSTRINDPVTRF